LNLSQKFKDKSKVDLRKKINWINHYNGNFQEKIYDMKDRFSIADSEKTFYY